MTAFGGSAENRTQSNCLQDSRSSLRATEPVVGPLRVELRPRDLKGRCSAIKLGTQIVAGDLAGNRTPIFEARVRCREPLDDKTVWMGSKDSNLEHESQSLERCQLRHFPVQASSK